MNYKTYEVRVYTNGDKEWYLNGKRHREDGPAVEYADGSKLWWLNGEYLTKKNWKKRLVNLTYDSKVVEIDGKQYQLKEIK